VEGNWKQVKGKVKEKWGQLTDDDLDVINGRRDQLEGKIQERYGLARDRVRQDIDDWGLLPIEWVIFRNLSVIPVFNGDAMADR
jgi:uncharacterized protein YjbJ (UPF0337 family)